MLNEEQVKLMTKMAAYEQGEGKENIKIGNYFRGDYVGMQILKTIIFTTIAYGIVFGMYIFYEFEILLEDIYMMDLLDFGKNIVASYFITIVVFSVYTYVLYLYRYNRVRRKLKAYHGNLRKLSKYYEDRE